MITPQGFEQRDVVVDVLADAFRDYPVTRWVLGDRAPYDTRARMLVELFVANRAWRGDPMLLLEQEGAAVGAVTMTLPASPEAPPELVALRETIWAELGREERLRYDEFARASAYTGTTAPHHHINMLGVRTAFHGQGCARALLEAAHAIADADPLSPGVSLSTELSRNVTLYEHFGYHVASHARVSDALETWTMFRPRETPAMRRRRNTAE